MNSNMDFSRNGQGFNMCGNMMGNEQHQNVLFQQQQPGQTQDDMNNMGGMDQDMLRRFAATRGAGVSMGQDGNAFGMMPGAGIMTGNMFGQNMTQNQLPGGASGMGQNGNGSDPRLSMMHQAEREEELLLQLLLARRRRQEIQQDFHPDQDRNNQQGNFAEELSRLRQVGNAAAPNATTAAMFAGTPEQQQDQFPQQQGGMFPMFPQGAPGLNFPPGPNAFAMMKDQAGSTGLRAPNVGAPNIPTNSFAGGRRFDDFFFRSQQQQPQDSMFNGFSGDPQRLEPSSSRLLSPQQQAAAGFVDPSNKRTFGDNFKMIGGGDLEKVDRDVTSKKRQHKKKPSDMPRRPLSAYNLFFSEERERILKEIDAGKGSAESEKKDAVNSGDDNEEPKIESQKDEADGAANSSDTSKKPRALLRPLLPSQKKRRPHRKTHGKISFRQLAQMVGKRWKGLPVEERKYYQQLAKEDMIRQKKAMEEYYRKQSGKSEKKVDVFATNNQEETTKGAKPETSEITGADTKVSM